MRLNDGTDFVHITYIVSNVNGLTRCSVFYLNAEKPFMDFDGVHNGTIVTETPTCLTCIGTTAEPKAAF